MKSRCAHIKRHTRETKITLSFNLDGKGKVRLETPLGFLNHMLELFAFHGLFDLDLQAKGDTHVDVHHLNEDIGIVLGEAVKSALRDKKGISRFGCACVPMEEVLAQVALDISGRGYLSFHLEERYKDKKDGYSLEDSQHFFESFAKHAGINLSIIVHYPSRDLHTTLEPVFKAFGMALQRATRLNPRRQGIPSTKGIID